MNSRQRRKLAAQEHNDRIELMRDLSELQLAVYTKHGVRVRVMIDDSNSSVAREIEKLRGILEADAPPVRDRVAVLGSSGLSKLHAIRLLGLGGLL